MHYTGKECSELVKEIPGVVPHCEVSASLDVTVCDFKAKAGFDCSDDVSRMRICSSGSWDRQVPVCKSKFPFV